jgi:hypothetical protein
VLPGAKSAEGVAAGEGSTFFAGELFTGAITKVTCGRAPQNRSSPRHRGGGPSE